MNGLVFLFELKSGNLCSYGYLADSFSSCLDFISIHSSTFKFALSFLTDLSMRTYVEYSDSAHSRLVKFRNYLRA